MVICVEQELQYLQEELTKRGYTVVTNRDNNISCEAIICNLKNGGLLNLNMDNNLKREGTLIIDSGSKSIEEIEYILCNRGYSSLFWSMLIISMDFIKIPVHIQKHIKPIVIYMNMMKK